MPNLSIITVNLNNLAGLQKTMQSVFEQTFSNYEYIIIDGGSTDGSKEWIAQHADKLSYWVSEKDNGIYSAMNKGISQSKGEYLLFLNSGDRLVNTSVLAEIFFEDNSAEILYGDIIWENESLQTQAADFPDNLSFEFFFKNSLPHQGTFIQQKLFYKFGYYDESLKIVSDWKFFVECICRYNVSYKHLKLTISVCDRSGISCKPEYLDLVLAEKRKVFKESFPLFLNQYDELFKLRQKLRIATSSFGFKLHKKCRKFFGLKSGINSI